MADPHARVQLDAFCDVRAPAATARVFAMPELAPDGQGVAVTPGTWRWVNVWATWCHPCIEEMPLVLGWKQRLSRQGIRVDLVFMSVDADAQTVATYRQGHPDTPPSTRIKASDALGAWVESVGLDRGATIPIHVFVDPANKARCVRTGSIGEDDFDNVKAVLTGA